MKNKRMLLATLVGTLALGSWGAAEPSWAQLPGLKNLSEGVTTSVADGLRAAAKKAKEDLRVKLEQTMRDQLAHGFKKIDAELEEQLKKLPGQR